MIEEMVAIEEVETEIVEINDLEEMIGEMAEIEGIETEIVEINDLEEMIEEMAEIEGIETEIVDINDLEEIKTKIKQEMVIGFAKVVETIILHLEPSVTDVGNQERAMIWVKEKIEEKIIDEQKKDHNEETEIEEIDVKILEVDLVGRTAVEILEEVVVQTTLEIAIEGNSTHKVMNRALHRSKEGRENVRWKIRR